MNRVILSLLAKRLLIALLSLLAVSVIVFSITAVLPGDAAQEQLGQDATPEALAALRTQMGLNVPAPERYLKWLGGVVRGDLGQSVTTQIGHVHLIAVSGQKTGQPLTGFGVEDTPVLDGAVHHQDGIGMHGDTGLNMAHMQPMLATGDKQGLLQQFHLVLCSSLSGFQLQRLSRQASAPSRQSTPSRS